MDSCRGWLRSAVCIGLCLMSLSVAAQPLFAPGDTQLRNDLQLLNDAGLINVPLTSWPIAGGDLAAALKELDTPVQRADVNAALGRVRASVRREMATDSPVVTVSVAGALEPRLIRSFEDAPRDEGEINASLSWMGDRFAVNLAVTGVANPFDDEKFRADGSYVGVALGNWMLTAGWQDRWWGPSRDGSLILSTNARPTPGVALQRIVSTPFNARWLKWVGPWTLTSFMTELDDERTVNDARLFGVRGSFRPPNTGLEIGISRSAQWCGDGRPCDLSTFGDLLVGNDNRGVNVIAEDEPGNQLGGFDIRWRLPKQIPLALYMQWIGEDGRGGGGAIGSWLRQVGVEHWGEIGDLSHRTHLEVSDTTCRRGGFGFSEASPRCAYNHSIYQTGYRYRGKAIGHPIDGEGSAYSIGSTLVQSGGHSWNILLRYMEINRAGLSNSRHTLIAPPQDIVDVQITHRRSTSVGRFYAGIGFQDVGAQIPGSTGSGASVFLQWQSQ